MAKHIPLALAVLLAACYGPDVPLGAPCLEDIDCPSGQTCNLEEGRCDAPSELLAWRDDTAADFSAGGSLAGGVAIEQAGFVGPVAYFAGGLRLSGIDKNAIPNPATPWNEIENEARSGTSFVRGIELDFADGVPLGLGLSNADRATVLVEGEIYLETAGTWQFDLNANDIGFIELAPPGSSTFQRVVTDENTGTQGRYEVVTPGWHQLRGAFADRSGNMDYQLRYDPPGPGNFKDIPFYDLRAPASDVAGYIVDGFEDPFLLGPDGSVLLAGTLAGQSFAANPLGLPIGLASYSLRFAAQVLIDVDGSYAFRIDSTQGHRAWLDGVLVANRFGTVSEVSVTPPVPLEPGWHDLVVDVHKNGPENGRLDMTVESGPTWVGQAIPLDHLRPVVGRATRWAGGFSDVTATIPDAGTPLVRSVSFDVPPDMVTTQIDVSFQVSHPVQAQLEIQIDPPVGVTATVVAQGTLMGTGTFHPFLTRPANTAGGGWNIIATDTVVDAMAGNLSFAAVTLTGSAGPAPFETRYHYVSAPRDLGHVASLTHVKWALRQVRPEAMVTVSLRTCDSAAACDAEPWTAVADGTRPSVPVRRFAQYMVELTSNGDVPTALDWIELGYRAYTD